MLNTGDHKVAREHAQTEHRMADFQTAGDRPHDTQPKAGRNGSATTKRVFDLLLAQIVGFERKPYDEISEGSLAEELSVSRTPVRESLAKLAKLQLVDIFPQRGSQIAPIRLRSLRRAQFLRESLELGLLRRALGAPDKDRMIGELEAELLVQQAMAGIGDHARFCMSDEQFHRRIAVSAGLPDIWDDISDAKLHIDRVGSLMLESAETMPAVVLQHAAIVAAMKSGDLSEVEAALKIHLRRIFGFLEAAHIRHPGYFEADEWLNTPKIWFAD
jgi:GntR family transcriptional regulator, rspAB operon transcriptional repressor